MGGGGGVQGGCKGRIEVFVKIQKNNLGGGGGGGGVGLWGQCGCERRIEVGGGGGGGGSGWM